MNECETQHFRYDPLNLLGFASRAQPTDLTNQLVDTAVAGLYTYGVKPLDINDATFMSNISHKLAAGLTGCLSAKAAGNRCEAGSIGAVVGEMWGDHQVDDPNTLTQAQKKTNSSIKPN